MVLSGATALYIGNQSYSKAYIGDTLVWSTIQPTTLTKINDISGLSDGDEIVLAGYNSIVIQ